MRLLEALAAATEAKDRQNVRLLQQNADAIAENHVHSERVLYAKFNTVVVFIIKPILAYGAETWTMTKKEEQALLIFEGKIFRRIYGPKYEDGIWKSRTNRELEEISKGENIVKWIKGQRISWLGHLERMEEDRMTKRSSLKNWKGRVEEEDPGKDGQKKWKEIFKCWE